MSKKYSDNTDFIMHLKSANDILLPKMRNEEYTLMRILVSLNESKNSYLFWFFNDKKKLDFAFEPIKKEFQDKKPMAIIEDYSLLFNEKLETVEQGKAKYGEYVVLDSSQDSELMAQTIFIVDDYIITASCNGEWKNEYFDYFDFEKVTLK